VVERRNDGAVGGRLCRRRTPEPVHEQDGDKTTAWYVSLLRYVMVRVLVLDVASCDTDTPNSILKLFSFGFPDISVFY